MYRIANFGVNVKGTNQSVNRKKKNDTKVLFYKYSIDNVFFNAFQCSKFSDG